MDHVTRQSYKMLKYNLLAALLSLLVVSMHTFYDHTSPAFFLLCGLSRLLCSIESSKERRLEALDLFQSNADSDETRLDAEIVGPVELEVVRQQGVRARQRKVGPQTRTLVAFERVKEGLARFLRAESQGKQSSVPALACRGESLSDPVVFRGDVSRVIHPFEHAIGRAGRVFEGPRDEHLGQVVRVVVDDRNSMTEIPRVSFHVDGVLGEVVILVPVFLRRLQLVVKLGVRRQYQAVGM